MRAVATVFLLHASRNAGSPASSHRAVDRAVVPAPTKSGVVPWRHDAAFFASPGCDRWPGSLGAGSGSGAARLPEFFLLEFVVIVA